MFVWSLCLMAIHLMDLRRDDFHFICGSIFIFPSGGLFACFLVVFAFPGLLGLVEPAYLYGHYQ